MVTLVHTPAAACTACADRARAPGRAVHARGDGRRVVTPAVAAAELGAWEPPDEAQRALKYALLAFLDARPADACDRSCVPGHLTASALVLDAAGEHVLLTLHPRVGRWIQLGGHCEPGDATLRAAALREATEESGIAGLDDRGGAAARRRPPGDVLARRARRGTWTCATSCAPPPARSR